MAINPEYLIRSVKDVADQECRFQMSRQNLLPLPLPPGLYFRGKSLQINHEATEVCRPLEVMRFIPLGVTLSAHVYRINQI